MYRITWKSTATGATGHGEYSFETEEACYAAIGRITPHAWNIKYWPEKEVGLTMKQKADEEAQCR